MKANLKNYTNEELEVLHEAISFVVTFDEDQERRYKNTDTPKSETKFLKRFDKKLRKLIANKLIS